MSKRFGFTLAEVLITLGIIGILASMTIPSLLQNQQDQAAVSQLKKSFNTLSQAYATAVATEGEMEGWDPHPATIDDATRAQWIGTFIKYLNIQKNCNNTDTGCIPSAGYKYLNDNGNYYTAFNSDTTYYKYILADGSSLLITPGSTNGSSGYYLASFSIWVDINGPKNPNRLGYDVFAFFATTVNGVQASGTTSGALTGGSCRHAASSYVFNRCAPWALFYGNLDYKYVNNLEWDVITHK